GISRLDFILVHSFPENSPENTARRKNLIQDVARFFAIVWKAPQVVDQDYLDRRRRRLGSRAEGVARHLPVRAR
ncbi:hypothetical protein BT67DRAFT_387564, partial [Trichocladium antarcticum]